MTFISYIESMGQNVFEIHIFILRPNMQISVGLHLFLTGENFNILKNKNKKQVKDYWFNVIQGNNKVMSYPVNTHYIGCIKWSTQVSIYAYI